MFVHCNLTNNKMNIVQKNIEFLIDGQLDHQEASPVQSQYH